MGQIPVNQNQNVNNDFNPSSGTQQQNASKTALQADIQATQQSLDLQATRQAEQQARNLEHVSSQTQALAQNAQPENGSAGCLKPTEAPKKKSRKRMTNAQTQDFEDRCVALYRQGKDTKLIAFLLGVREAQVEHAVFAYVQSHPEQATKSSIFLAAPSTRIRELTANVGSSGYYEAIPQIDGTVILRVIAQPHTA